MANAIREGNFEAIGRATEWPGAEAVNAPATHVMLGGTLVAFQQAESVQPSVGSVIDHYGISVPDIEAAMRKLEGSGAKILEPVREQPGLFKLAFFEDPFGAKVELVQDTEWPGFHHIHLMVEDPTETLAWYEKMVGGTREKLKGQVEGLRYDGIWLLARESGGKRLAPSAERSIRNVAWSIVDMDEAIAALKAVGAKTLIEPFTVGDTVRVVFYEDLNGVSVELLQLP